MAAWLLVSGLVASVFADPSEDYSHYLSNKDLAHYLNITAIIEPGLASFYSIGFTEQTWDIPVLELTAAESLAQVPNVKFIAGVHGDEPIGTQVLIKFIEYLLDAYRREERFVTWLLNNTRIHILPRLNLEGFELAIEGVCNLGPGRNNSAGYDLNRAFSPSGDYVFEAAAVMSWMKNDVYVLSASVNAGEMVVVYPPDNIEDNGGLDATTDDDVFKHLASVYARNHRSMSTENGCKDSNFNNGTISGAAWYPVKGSMQDYNYQSGTMELTLEISCCKYPPSDQIASIWEENRLVCTYSQFNQLPLPVLSTFSLNSQKQSPQALLKLAAESCRGVRGKVTALGNAIAGAMVSILGRNMTVRTNDQGYYFRILLPGRYFMKVEARGMKTFITEFFVPESDTAFIKWEVVNVQLELESSKQPDNAAEEQTITYDEGGLEPYTTPNYDDSYSSSIDDSLVRELVKGAASTKYKISFYSIFIVIFCKYLIVGILGGLVHTDCILFLE